MPLFYHTGALGDFLLAVPFLRALRRAFGDVPWTLVAAEAHAALVSRWFPHIRRGVPGLLEFAPLAGGGGAGPALGQLLDRHGGIFGFARDAEAIEREARHLRPGLQIVLSEPFARTTSLGEDIETTLERAIDRVEGRARRLGYGDFALARDELPQLEGSRDPLEFLGSRDRSRVALIHIGASGPSKTVPLPVWEEVARRLVGGEPGGGAWTVGWIRGPVEVERRIDLPGGPHLDAPDIVHLAHAVAAAGLYLGSDTGPTHLASALGVPTIAVHGKDSSSWRPRGHRARRVAGSSGFPSVESVIGTAADLLTGAP